MTEPITQETRAKFMIMSGPDMGTEARKIFKKDRGYGNKTQEALDTEIQQSLLKTPYSVCAELWNMIKPYEKEELFYAHPAHLFWALLFLGSYCTEAILTRVVGGVDNKTYRKWAWLFIDAISELKQQVIVWGHRFDGWDGSAVCLVSVDGIDCAIQEPYPFNKGIFSHKLNGPGYKYEVAVCIATGHIVWINGPFPAGRSDVTIFTEDGLADALAPDECVEVDSGYQGDERLKNPNVALTRIHRAQKSQVRARHEIINSWLKKFSVLDQVFRHNSDVKHQKCFQACSVITQLRFELCGGLYDVEYDVVYT